MDTNKTISVTVKLFGGFESPLFEVGQDPMIGIALELPKGARIKKVMALVGFEPCSALLCFVNGEMAGKYKRLQEGDVVSFFRPVAGG